MLRNLLPWSSPELMRKEEEEEEEEEIRDEKDKSLINRKKLTLMCASETR